jgi:glycerol-3-phosphate dehydrogenase
MPFSTRDLKQLAFKPVKAVVNSIDLLKIADYLAKLEPGKSYLEKSGAPRPAFADQEEIIQRTIEMTAADLASRNEKAPLRELEDHARRISCRYDPEVHVKAKAAAFTVLGHVFDHDDLGRIFVSEDRRELKHLERLKQARQDGLGVVYLVNHSSHLDEFIVDVVLDQLGIELPLFAAGANMMATPSLEKILMIGSYLIIRKSATKPYLATLFQYCRALCEMGKQQGIFLEAWAGGARTRDGSLRFPRRLVTLQGALASEKDILVQPVTISYSVVPEDLALSERAPSLTWLYGLKYGRNWLRRPFHPLRAAGAGLSNLYGRAYISFCQPKLLSELDAMRAADPSDLTRDEFVALYSMREIARDKKIMASQLTARGLIRAREENELDLVAATQAELDDVIEFHRRTFHQAPDLEDFIRNNSLETVVEDGLRRLKQRRIVDNPERKGEAHQVLRSHALSYYATHGDRRLYSPSAKENIVIIGAAAWGVGFASLIGRRALEEKKYLNVSLTLFDSREDLVGELIDTRVHPVHFPDSRLPKNVFPSADATAAFRKATEALITTSIEFFETDLRRLLEEANQSLNLIISTRGFDQISHRLPIQIAMDVVNETRRTDVNLLVISGPVTPKKLVEERGGSLVLAGPPRAARQLSNLFNWSNFTCHVCDDPVGVQVAGTMCEVYTLLGSYLLRTKEIQGRGQVASFFTETSQEVMKFALALGGRRETFLPDNPAWSAEYLAAGMGGPGATFGRQAGRSLSRAKHSARDFLSDNGRDHREDIWQFIGYTGIRSAYLAAKSLNLEMPRLRQAYRIFWKD